MIIHMRVFRSQNTWNLCCINSGARCITVQVDAGCCHQFTSGFCCAQTYSPIQQWWPKKQSRSVPLRTGSCDVMCMCSACVCICTNAMPTDVQVTHGRCGEVGVMQWATSAWILSVHAYGTDVPQLGGNPLVLDWIVNVRACVYRHLFLLITCPITWPAWRPSTNKLCPLSPCSKGSQPALCPRYASWY